MRNLEKLIDKIHRKAAFKLVSGSKVCRVVAFSPPLVQSLTVLCCL